jgi:dTDP-4-dehydrorhamnose 3,5-epimerase
MKFEATPLAGAFLLELDRIEDDRGFFARTFCAEEFARRGLAARIAQTSIAFNEKKGTLRGLHWQAAPHEEAKIVRCVRGAVLDVLVDVRPGSPTFRKWAAFELGADDRRALYVPEGVAHGY